MQMAQVFLVGARITRMRYRGAGIVDVGLRGGLGTAVPAVEDERHDLDNAGLMTISIRVDEALLRAPSLARLSVWRLRGTGLCVDMTAGRRVVFTDGRAQAVLPEAGSGASAAVLQADPN
jgi:hypothetical protein